jgi:hypothetical protein
MSYLVVSAMETHIPFSCKVSVIERGAKYWAMCHSAVSLTAITPLVRLLLACA